MLFGTKKVVSLFLLTFAILSCSTGCGRQYEANPMTPSSFAYVQAACGPTDGPAVEFYFTLKPSQLGRYEAPFLMISINENLPSSGPQDYSIKPGKYAVLASRCVSPGHCDAATSGTLHLATFSLGQGATGEYELHFQEGRVERDSFDAKWYVAKQLMCG